MTKVLFGMVLSLLLLGSGAGLGWMARGQVDGAIGKIPFVGWLR